MTTKRDELAEKFLDDMSDDVWGMDTFDHIKYCFISGWNAALAQEQPDSAVYRLARDRTIEEVLKVVKHCHGEGYDHWELIENIKSLKERE